MDRFALTLSAVLRYLGPVSDKKKWTMERSNVKVKCQVCMMLDVKSLICALLR